MTDLEFFLNNADPISRSDLKAAGINIDNIETCRRFRKLAENNSLTVDKSIHRDNPRSQHLFNYIKYCGYDLDAYVRDYLRHIQPYMIKRFPSQEKREAHLCILDENYRVSLYIKANMEKDNQPVISFHENTKDGFAKDNRAIIAHDKYVPVIADTILSNHEGSNRYVIKCLIQRGTLALPINVTGYLAEGDIFIVERQAIEQEFIDHCNDYIRGLYTSNLHVAEDMELFSVMQQIAFTSHGNSTFSNISKLIDNMDIQPVKENRSAASCVLITYINHLILTKTDQEELIKLLEDKKLVKPSKLYEPAIDSCIDAIANLPGPSAPVIPEITVKEKDGSKIPDDLKHLSCLQDSE